MKIRAISGWLCLFFSVLAILMLLVDFKNETINTDLTNLEKIAYEKNEKASLEAFRKENSGESPGGRLEAEMLGTSSLGEPKTSFNREELTNFLSEGTSTPVLVPQRREGALSSIFLPQNYCEKTIICEEFKKKEDYCIDTESGDCLQIQPLTKGSMEEFFKIFHEKLLTQTKKTFTESDLFVMITLHVLDFSEENPSEKEFTMRVVRNSKPLTILILKFIVDEERRVHISIVGRGNEKVFSTSD